MHDWEGIGYWVWGAGTVLLGVAFAWSYITYRRQGFRELPEERERIARQNAAARRESRPDDPGPAQPRDVRPLVVMICAALATAAIVLGLAWMNRSPTFGGDRPPIAQSR